MGRPTSCTPDSTNRIAQGIQLGATYEMAANYGGVSYDSFLNWMKRGKAEIERRQSSRVQEDTARWQREQTYVQFFEAIKKAESVGIMGWLAKIEKAANDGQWQAAAWKLERRYPETYARQRIEHTGADGGNINIEYVNDWRKTEAED